MKAQELLEQIKGTTASASRDARIVDAARAGGLMPWPWVEVPVYDLEETSRVIGFFRVQSDYVAIGDEKDWVRVPVGGAAAQQIADYAGGILPSAYMVHLIWKASPIKLTPITFPNQGMTSTARFVEHHKRIEAQRANRAGLIAGCKKDTVVSNKLLKRPNATAIFGWHYPNGRIIQPISTAHDQPWYSDYSHGVRLVAPEMVLNNERVSVQEVLQDPARARVITGGAPWLRNVDGLGDEVLRVVRYGQPVQTTPTTSQPPPTTVSAVSTVLTTDDLGQRALRWCKGELDAGVREEPPGSNASPRIAQYFKQARRRATGKLLGITAGDWCAVAQSAALSAAAPIGSFVPHGYRAAVWELREDAKVTGAWVPAREVRSGQYRIAPGDLLCWTRGAPGLGHVSRAEHISRDGSEVTTLGGNENNAWTRRNRNIHEKEFEGVIKYSGFRAVMTLEQNNEAKPLQPLRAAPTSTESSSPAPGDEDAWAQRVFLRAWEREFGTTPSAQERQTILAIARHERFYGLSKTPASGIGANNWGGVQCPGRGPCNDGCYSGRDKDRDGEGYRACFKKYPTPEDGARHLIQLVTRRRPHVHEAMRAGNLSAVAREMGTERTIGGKLYRAYHQSNVNEYGAALWLHAQQITRALGEPVAVQNDGTTPPASGPTHHSKPAPQPQTPSTRVDVLAFGPRSTMQNGIRAIVSSRQPELARVVVGEALPSWQPLASELEGRLLNMGGEIALQADTTAQPITGVMTETGVVDYARRVDNYIRALHAIIADERSKRAQPDGFPWNEWAAFRATWDETFFLISHSFVPQFDDTVVSTYDELSKKWADVVHKHYGRRPEQPEIESPASVAKTAVIAVTALAGAGMLVYALKR